MPQTHNDVSYPPSWYVICVAHELAIGQTREVEAMGETLVAYRGADGRARVTGGNCPHRGSQLFRGGHVEGNQLVCNAHGSRWNGETGAGEGRRRCPAKLRTYPVRERYGAVLFWYHPEQAPPSFEPPPLPTFADGTPYDTLHWRSQEPYRTDLRYFLRDGIDDEHFEHTHRLPGAVTTACQRGHVLDAYTRSPMAPSRMLAVADVDVPIDPHTWGERLVKGLAERMDRWQHGQYEFSDVMHGAGITFQEGVTRFPGAGIEMFYLLVSTPLPIRPGLIQARFAVSQPVRGWRPLRRLHMRLQSLNIAQAYEDDRPQWEGQYAYQGRQHARGGKNHKVFDRWYAGLFEPAGALTRQRSA